MDISRQSEAYKKYILGKWDGRRSIIDKAFESSENGSREYLRKLCEYLCTTKSSIYLHALAIYKYKWYIDVPLKEVIDEVNQDKDADYKISRYDEWLSYVGPIVENYPLFAYVEIFPQVNIYNRYPYQNNMYIGNFFYAVHKNPLIQNFWSSTSLDSFHDTIDMTEQLGIDKSDRRQELKIELKQELKEELKEELKLENEEDAKKKLQDAMTAYFENDLLLECKERIRAELKQQITKELQQDTEKRIAEAKETATDREEYVKMSTIENLRIELMEELRQNNADELRAELKDIVKRQLEANPRPNFNMDAIQVKDDLKRELKAQLEVATGSTNQPMRATSDGDQLPMKQSTELEGNVRNALREMQQLAQELPLTVERKIKTKEIRQLREELMDEIADEVANGLRELKRKQRQMIDDLKDLLAGELKDEILRSIEDDFKQFANDFRQRTTE